MGARLPSLSIPRHHAAQTSTSKRRVLVELREPLRPVRLRGAGPASTDGTEGGAGSCRPPGRLRRYPQTGSVGEAGALGLAPADVAKTLMARTPEGHLRELVPRPSDSTCRNCARPSARRRTTCSSRPRRKCAGLSGVRAGGGADARGIAHRSRDRRPPSRTARVARLRGRLPRRLGAHPHGRRDVTHVRADNRPLPGLRTVTERSSRRPSRAARP